MIESNSNIKNIYDNFKLNYKTNINTGLTQKEVDERVNNNKINTIDKVRTKTYKKIILDSIFTLFNFINIILFLLVLFTGSYKNGLFIGTVICNLFIGIYQEIRSKRAVDKLSILNTFNVDVIRDSNVFSCDIEKLVIDDIILLYASKQIPSDSIILDGSCEVDESMITGESDPIFKNPGDVLMSGSFIISGSVKAQVVNVGKDNYVNNITNSIDYKKIEKSHILKELKKIIKYTAIIIVPIGGLLFLKQVFVLKVNFNISILTSVAVMVGMIPEGLILLSSLVMVISVYRLAKYKVLVQQMYSIENLSKSNIICFDKTGTITSGKMNVDDIIALYDNNHLDIVSKIKSMLYVLDDNNETSQAIKKYCEKFDIDFNKDFIDKINFSSKRKYSAVKFSEKETYIIGAVDFANKDIFFDAHKKAYDFMNEGKRILALFYTEKNIENLNLPDNMQVLALIVIEDEIREHVSEYVQYIYDQDVDIKIISGDNPITVSNIAKKVNIRNYDKYIDISKLTDDEIRRCVLDYTIFVRATPFQKKLIIKELKHLGNTVAMTGDGVNDTLALKEADCSIAMASGSDAARNISSIILLDSDFKNLFRIIEEGRRAINNIQKTASLFISKTLYSSFLGMLFILVNLKYPFLPIHMTIINITCIGLPSFFLSFQPDFTRVRGDFLKNVLYHAFPTSVSVFLNIVFITFIGNTFNMESEYISTICILVTEFSSLYLLYEISKPLTKYRLFVFLFVISIFVVSVIFFNGILTIMSIDLEIILSSLLFVLPTFIFRLIGRKIYYKLTGRRKFIF